MAETMNIRQWFGSTKEYDQSTPAAISLDGFLEMYAKATKQYLDCAESASLHDIVNYTPRSNLAFPQQLFIGWIENKGIPLFDQILNSELPESDLFIAHIEYEKYILEAEMDFEYPDDVRSCLINISHDLPYEIKENLKREKDKK